VNLWTVLRSEATGSTKNTIAKLIKSQITFLEENMIFSFSLIIKAKLFLRPISALRMIFRTHRKSAEYQDYQIGI